MLAKKDLSQILDDDALTRGLADPEARALVEWLVERAERLGAASADEAEVRQGIRRLCGRGRLISRFVLLWCHRAARGAAVQLAATERFGWPLPTRAMDPCELMQSILAWEDRQYEAAALAG